jgi:arginyl-tRNA synthetase
MKEELAKAVEAACKELFDVNVRVELTRPDEQFGDYATNAALQLAGKINGNPREIAESIAGMHDIFAGLVDEISVAGPGFLNFKLTDDALWKVAKTSPPKKLEGQKVVAEYSDPNPFKVLHAGHLYTSVAGDALANLLETAGGEVHRVNFGGDVGLHVGKTMWAILGKLGGDPLTSGPDRLAEIPEDKRSEWMAELYVEGTNAYEDDEAAKDEIIKLNKRVYQLHAEDDRDSPFAQIYWTCRQWSYDYFDEFYARIGSKFEKYYPESSVAGLGLKTVKENVGKVFNESDGAIVFKGDDHGLHTRVFINSEGIPTYEAKDVGLIMQKWEDYHFDRSIVITGNEQMQYMQVVLKAIEQFSPELAQNTTHLTHGLVKLQGGVKMSSRSGNILRAVDVLDAAAAANKKLTGNEDEQVAIEGNSGPYIQYAHARARSILRKVENKEQKTDGAELEAGERSLLRKISEYPEMIEKATDDLMPHHICTYLYELAQTFNRFYEKNRVIDDPRQAVRLKLVEDYADTLKNGLRILGIHAPESM